MKTLCIYHDQCADGFTAATIVRTAFGAENVEFVRGWYGMTPPDATGRDVVIVDFSFPRDELIAMADRAKSILVLDHHKTAQHQLVYLPDNVHAEFDMDRSGAMMAWQWFNPGTEAPAMVQHVQDRDLWQFRLPGTREIMAALFSYPFDFDIWESLLFGGTAELKTEGEAIHRAQQKAISEHIRANAYRGDIAGHRVPLLCAPRAWASDAGAILSDGEPFAAIYCDTGDQRQFSLRSTKTGIDVAKVAEQYGGGGHANAAGFSVPLTAEWII